MRKPPVLNKLAAALLALASGVLAVGVPAGTLIENRATMVFTPPGGTQTEVDSPPVITVVKGVCRPSVIPNGTVAAPGQSKVVQPGNQTLFSYTLTNSGNATNTFALTTPIESASQFNPTNLGIVLDANKNGSIDPGENPITQLSLAADASAALLVRAAAPLNATGNAYLNLVAACTTNQAGGPSDQDDDNVAQLKLSEPPQLAITKSFNPSKIKPGEETSVQINVVNKGGVSKEVVITDFLNTPDMKDFTFVKGSASLSGSAQAKLEYSADGNTWVSAEPATVLALKATSSSLPGGATLTLSFKLRAADQELGSRVNVAKLKSDTLELEAPATVLVEIVKEIALGPGGNPKALPGGELSADDRQEKKLALTGQEICFPHTKQNLGERSDTLTTSGKVEVGEAKIIFRELDGTLINEPFGVTLAPQATKDFQACYVPSKPGGNAQQEGLRILLTSKSSLGAKENKTIDIVRTVYEQKLKLVKDSDKGEGNLVAPGEEFSYQLTFTNGQSFALKNVVIRDNLKVIGPKGAAPTLNLQFISADQGGQLVGNEVVWKFAQVNPGQTLTLKVKVRVPLDAQDDWVIVNRFTVSSEEITTPIPSNPTTNPVFGSTLSFIKISQPSTVRIGEEITYIFRVKNESEKATLNQVTVKDTLPTGLKYVDGSSTLDGAPIVPQVSGREYTWTIPGLAPGASAEIRFRAIVTADAPAQLRNNAVAKAVKGTKETKPVPGSATTKILPLDFGPNNADLVGYVFLDRNRNGIYDYKLDVPCHGARVILSNGRIALTDVEGRYHFRNIREGTWAVRLDPNSVGPQNLNVPQDAGRPGSRMVYVRNLTSLDFPLIPDAGDIAIIRDTTLTMKGGPKAAQNSMSVRKQVFFNDKENLYTVQLLLKASANLPAFKLSDPLPSGATLLDGQNNLNFDPLPSGERLLTYRFRWKGAPKGAVTDPTASWRY